MKPHTPCRSPKKSRSPASPKRRGNEQQSTSGLVKESKATQPQTTQPQRQGGAYDSSSSTSARDERVEKCQKMIQKSLQNPKVKFLIEHLEKSGCAIHDNFIKAVICGKSNTGFYMRGKGILVCSEHMNWQQEVNQVVIHELIHAYDDCRAVAMNWFNCAHRACTEIRASHLSGDCHFKRELIRGYMMKIRGHEQECVRRRAMKSVMGCPNCPEAVAKHAVEAVWDICYNDTQPFDRAL